MRSFYKLTLLAFITTSCFAQTAESIMKNYTKNSGGQANWDRINSFKIIGKAKLIMQGGMELPFERIMKKDGKLYTSLKYNGMNYIAMAHDGKKVWGSNQQMVSEEKDTNTSKNTKLLKHDFPYPGHNWKAHGYQITYVGKATIDSTDTYKIKLTKKPQWVDGKQVENSIYIYYNTENYLPIYQESKVASGPQKGQTMQTYLSDYKKVNGLYYPFTTTMKYDGKTSQVITTEIVIWNPTINDSIFEMPKE